MDELLTLFAGLKCAEEKALHWVRHVMLLSLLAVQVHDVSNDREVEM